MNLFNLLKRKPTPPQEIVTAACDFYGLDPETVSVETEKLNALSKNLWVVTLNNQSSALVSYDPKDNDEALAAPWYDEREDSNRVALAAV